MYSVRNLIEHKYLIMYKKFITKDSEKIYGCTYSYLLLILKCEIILVLTFFNFSFFSIVGIAITTWRAKQKKWKEAMNKYTKQICSDDIKSDNYCYRKADRAERHDF